MIILARNRIGPHKIDMNSQDEGKCRTALHLAADCGHELVVETLLTCQDVNTESRDIGGHTPLALAVMGNHRGVVALLTKGRSVLQNLAAEGDLAYIHSLLKSGCDVDNRDTHGHTPLHVAALWNKSSIVKELLCWNPDINLEDVYGLTPLRIAMNNRCKDIVTMLLHKSANPEAVLGTEWFEVYGRRASLHLLHFSQNQAGEKSVNFVSKSAGRLELEPETDRHMVLFREFDSWCKHLADDMPYFYDPNPARICGMIRPHQNYANITLVGQYPVEYGPRSKVQKVQCHWNKCAIAWKVKPPSKSDNSSIWISMVHFSMVEIAWIPSTGASFLIMFLQHLRIKWLAFCTSAAISLSQRRSTQLEAQGGDGKLIRLLAEDAQTLAMLRSVLQSQILTVKTFADEYCHSYDRGGGQQIIYSEINLYDVDVSKCIQQLEQTVKDLLQFEFAWVSINEAQRSTSTATSVKRLSWVTFVFLPAMFASSLFGMNVNILESNPDWRWFILVVTVLLVTSISIWLLFKYGQIEKWIEKSFGDCIQRATQTRRSEQEMDAE
ncbi:hypothetical protein IQ07DRAFT_548142 [Pyrenochaeta sp. DS3sAY3a]|nr:hypothetical protein IQ07DRAFT_548142 [Pyrenochaeta sp. DS3sAY3a]